MTFTITRIARFLVATFLFHRCGSVSDASARMEDLWNKSQ